MNAKDFSQIKKDYKTLKAAYCAGWHKIKKDEYGGECIEVKGKILVNYCQTAESRAVWKHWGFEPDDKHRDNPHTIKRHRAHGGMIAYPVYRLDQVSLRHVYNWGKGKYQWCKLQLWANYKFPNHGFKLFTSDTDSSIDKNTAGIFADWLDEQGDTQSASVMRDYFNKGEKE